MGRFGRKVKVAVVSGALILGSVGLGATVFASGPAGAEDEPTPGPPLPSRVEEAGPLFGVVHGDLELTKYDGTALSLVYDRGMITSITESEIAILRFDGVTVTVQVDSETYVREGLALSSLDELEVGDRAMFFSEQNEDGSLRAVLIRCISEFPPPRFGPPQPSEEAAV